MSRRVLPNDILLAEVSRLVGEGEKVTLKTKGNSMLPFIHGGKDSVILEKPEELSEGMIVLAEVAEGMYVLHRIVSVSGDTVVLMGDGNLKGCEICRASDVKAYATWILKKGKEIDCCSSEHMRQAGMWKALLPLRRLLLAVYKRIFV